jgi:hypothetical protein
MVMPGMSFMRIDDVSAYKETYRAARDYIGGVMLLSSDTRSAHDTCKPVRNPGNPFSIPIFVSDHGSQSPGCDGMSGRKTCSSIKEVSGSLGRVRPVSPGRCLQDFRYYQAVKQRFSPEYSGFAGLLVIAYNAPNVKTDDLRQDCIYRSYA